MKSIGMFTVFLGDPVGSGWRPALSLALLVVGAVSGTGFAESVIGSRHDLSVTPKRDPLISSRHRPSAGGGNPVKALVEKDVCTFCHTPHGGMSTDGPMWNRYDSTVSYTPYSSSTAKAHPGQPTGASKLCLSCHDGTVALGMLRNRAKEITFASGIRRMRSGRANLGTDLADDHPVSFVYDKALAHANGQLHDPAELKGRPVRLDRRGELQCTACHSAHNNQYGKFLVMDNTASALCNVCHDQRYWPASIHRTSNKQWDGAGPDPWPRTEGSTVAANACESCHAPHTAGTKQRLLNFANEEDNCYSCHNGHVASKDVQREFGKLSVHPVAQTRDVHDPYQEYQVDPINAPRHVECADCHNPHAVKSAPARAPMAAGALAGVTGISVAGNKVTPLTLQYEVCFRCHADSRARGSARVNRQFAQTNTRLEFDGHFASYHPVAVAGKNSLVPSLIAPWTTASLMYCTDCHNNDQGPGAGGGGPNGPHGSAYVPLLERQLVLTDFSAEGPDIYALCYKCHSRTSLLNDESFKQHKKHIVDAQTACTTCHDAHGAETVPHLVNFNTRYVSPSKTNGKLEYVDQSKSCSLMCHNKDHAALSALTNSVTTLTNSISFLPGSGTNALPSGIRFRRR
ncbi:MAG: hypothetical protein NTV49_05775 [Kiritimatiellaeota bacterium]|nr:hypothetical protein [Kiritimatiellota bacterium]